MILAINTRQWRWKPSRDVTVCEITLRWLCIAITWDRPFEYFRYMHDIAVNATRKDSPSHSPETV